MAQQLSWDLTAYEAGLCQEFILDIPHAVLHWCRFSSISFLANSNCMLKLINTKLKQEIVYSAYSKC
jgi:hypothetical protein